MHYLCLHGFTGTPQSFAPLALPDGAVVPSLSGHLETPSSGGFWQEVERLAALGTDCDGLVGYSLGGRLALGLLARYPTRYAHALVISARAGLATEDERRTRRSADARFVELLGQRGVPAFVDAWEELALWDSQRALPAAVRNAQRAARLRHSAEGLARSLIEQGLAEMPDLREPLARVTTPVDCLAGELDANFVAHARELCGIIPRARLTVAPGAGHNVLLENPELCVSLLH